MRVLHVHSGNLFGGVESTLLALAAHREVAPAMQPAFALCFAGRLASRLAGLGSPPSPLGPVRVRRPWTIVRARWRLADIIRRERVDAAVFHAPWTYALLGRTPRRLGVPVVVWLHGPIRRRHWLDRLAARVPPELVLCNSRFTERSVDALQPRPPGTVVHPPVSMPAEAPDARRAARAALGIADNTVVRAQVGRLDPI
jgi:glycosyltransferase involved in cell wall biosynthesis